MKTKILDCTIRDGGYLNEWQFDIEMVKDHYRSVSKSGVDYIEIGFRSTAKYFDPAEKGIWRFTSEETVSKVIGQVSGVPVSLMIDYGMADIDDIPDAVGSQVALYRIAVHKTKILEAIDFANLIAAKGYQTAIQLMGIVGYTEADFKRVLEPLKASQLTYVYFADSYGSLLPQDIKKYILILRDTGKALGFHPHNNMQLAFSNALAAIRGGIDIVDGTVFGMGRGAGNLPMETLITYFQKTIDENSYNVLPILELIDRHFLGLMERFPWGYNLPYMLSGVYEVHPNYAKALTDGDEYGIDDIQAVLQLIHRMNPVGYDKNIIPQIIQTGFIGNRRYENPDNEKDGSLAAIEKPFYENRHMDRDFLILANGPSLITYKEAIDRLIKTYDPVIIGSNFLGDLFVPNYHSFNNRGLFEMYINHVNPASRLLVCNQFQRDYIRRHTTADYELIQHIPVSRPDFNILNGIIQNNYKVIPVLTIATAIVMGARRIFIAGMDGYKDPSTFINKGFIDSTAPTGAVEQSLKLSLRTGTYQEQMEWHNYIELTLKQINDYLVTKDMQDLIIVTPTTHKLYYENIDNFLNRKGF